MTRKALSAPGARWRTLETPHATLYVLAGSAADESPVQRQEMAERAIVANLASLGAQDIGPKLRLFFVGSRDEIKRFTGSRAPGWSITNEGSAFFVANDTSPAALRHETMHLLSWRLWGIPSGDWLSEGIATAAVPTCGGQTTAQIVVMFDRAGMLVPLDALRHRFSSSGDAGFVYYYEAASLVQYIDRVYGRQKLRDLWSDGGLARVREILGVSLATLEHDWRATIAATPAREKWSSWPDWRAAMRARGCE